jgi:hypothetical protein
MECEVDRRGLTDGGEVVGLDGLPVVVAHLEARARVDDADDGQVARVDVIPAQGPRNVRSDNMSL